MAGESANAGDGVFATTHWSLVLAAGTPEHPDAAEALEALCRTYWFPIYAYVRRHGRSPEDAQDLTQEFFSRLLARGDFSVPRPEKGRFRSYLLGALKHFLADAADKARAAKRGGLATVFSLDAVEPEARYALELPSSEMPDGEFDRRWALTILDRALTHLRAEYHDAKKPDLFEALKPFLSSPPDTGEYQAAATKLNMNSGAIAVAVHRLRSRYAELVRAEIAQTVEKPADVDVELKELFEALS